MTKKHFIAFAREIARGIDAPEVNLNARLYAANVVIRIAREHNPRFDTDRFLKACGLGA